MGFSSLHPVIQHHIATTLRWPGLRPLQDAAVDPLLAGEDAILLAPTAGGKTEAAFFPVLSRMGTENFHGVSVLYLCPLKALLNNLEPRLTNYASWLGRRVGVWHGDVGQSARKKILSDQPDVLLTTPESLEAMMVSRGVDHQRFLGGVQAVIIDEVHSFAGDDRGWHLQGVLSRLEYLTGSPIQRIGMSATVGNPEDLLGWLQGSLIRPGRVINPDVPGAAITPELRVDQVESLDQAATLISKLHQGEKRLVFVDSRARAEKLAVSLSERRVDVYLSHSSLSAAERRRSEEAFATATDCVIVATSTLELGIDIGNLDRVIQIGSPSSVSSFLQRLGRTGRRAGTTRNCLFIALDDTELLQTLGMLNAWSEGFVEPVVPPVLPLHLVAQQILAACLSEGAIPRSTWRERWAATTLMSSSALGREADDVLDYLLSVGMLNEDGPYVFIGQAAEQAFGRRHFMELLSAFTSPPLFTVFAGRSEIGTVESHALTTSVEGPRVLALAGRSWKVNDINWSRRRVHVESTDRIGVARWGMSSAGVGAALAKGMRSVLLGAEPAGVLLTTRATEALATMRSSESSKVSQSGPVFIDASHSDAVEPEWWTWAGRPRNQQLIAWLGDSLAGQSQTARHDKIRLRRPLSPASVTNRIREVEELPAVQHPLPKVDDRALEGLKFFRALPVEWAREVVAARLVQE